MYMQIGDDKFIIKTVRFGKNMLVINGNLLITSYILNTWTKKKHTSLYFGKEEYILPQDFKKIERILEDM